MRSSRPRAWVVVRADELARVEEALARIERKVDMIMAEQGDLDEQGEDIRAGLARQHDDIAGLKTAAANLLAAYAELRDAGEENDRTRALLGEVQTALTQTHTDTTGIEADLRGALAPAGDGAVPAAGQDEGAASGEVPDLPPAA